MAGRSGSTAGGRGVADGATGEEKARPAPGLRRAGGIPCEDTAGGARAAGRPAAGEGSLPIEGVADVILRDGLVLVGVAIGAAGHEDGVRARWTPDLNP